MEVFRDCLAEIEPADADIYERSRERWLNIAKPLFSLGRLEELVSKIAAARRDIDAETRKKAIVIMCADNGVVSEGVAQSGSGVTAAVTENFRSGAACVSIFARRAGCDIFPIDIGVNTEVSGVTVSERKVRCGTGNIAVGAAMTREECVRAIEVGIGAARELAAVGYGLIGTGEMGIGNTTTAAAVASALLGTAPERVTGRGAGLSSEGLRRKISAVRRALEVNRPDSGDALDVMSRVGGLDIAGLCGVFLGCAAARVPAIIDGVISAAAALCACRLAPAVRDYMLPSHGSKEPASALLMDELGLKPCLDCEMFPGEGAGCAAIMPLIDMAADVYRKMPSFREWNGGEKYEVLK